MASRYNSAALLLLLAETTTAELTRAGVWVGVFSSGIWFGVRAGEVAVATAGAAVRLAMSTMAVLTVWTALFVPLATAFIDGLKYLIYDEKKKIIVQDPTKGVKYFGVNRQRYAGFPSTHLGTV